MKVLFVAHNFKAGGIQRQFIYLIRGLLERGIRLSLFVFDNTGEFLDEVPDGITVNHPKSPEPSRSLKVMWRVKEIAKVIRREQPDVIYSRHWSAKMPTAFAGRLLGKKVVISETNSLVSAAYRSRRNVYMRNMTRRLVDGIAAVSQGIADELEGLLKVNSKVRVIYNGFDLEEIEKKSREGVMHPWFGGEEPIAAAVGRLVGQKGFSYLLEAVKIVNRKTPLRLIIIGDGELRNELERQAEELGIKDRVDFVGTMKNPFAYVARCDLFVLSSLYEGFPNSLVEAMSLGMPVISTKCPHGPGEIIEDGKSGILVPVGSPERISEAILRVSGNGQLRDRLSVEAKKRARDFSLDNMVSKYIDLFQSVSGKV